MAYDKLIKMFEEEIAKEMDIREEIVYKKGYAEGYKDAEKQSCCCECKKDEDSIVFNETTADAYTSGLEDAWNTLKYVIFEQSANERKEMFGTQSIVKIVNDNTALDVMKALVVDAIEEKEEDEEDRELLYEAIGALLDSQISDEAKRKILEQIDNEDVEIKIVKIK